MRSATCSQGASPGMIGDFFGGSYTMFLPSIVGGTPPGSGTNVPISAGDRRFKVAENNSPFPMDRVFFNYHHFNNSLRDIDGRLTSLERYVIGIEKTFCNGLWSIEGRIPFASGLRADQFVGAGDANDATEFGNMSLVFKRLLCDQGDWKFSTGLGIVFPTGPVANMYDGGGALQLVIENEAVYFQPFLGAEYSPSDRLFVQMFAQLDFDTGGNTVNFIRANNGSVDGVIQDQTLMFLDMAVGYWIYRDCCQCSFVTGMAPMMELHYTSTIQDPDRVTVGIDTISTPYNRLDVLNMTAGLRFELRGRSYLTIAGVVPLRERREERIFDSEISMQFVRTF